MTPSCLPSRRSAQTSANGSGKRLECRLSLDEGIRPNDYRIAFCRRLVGILMLQL